MADRYIYIGDDTDNITCSPHTHTHTHTSTLCVWIVYLLVYRWQVVPHTPLMVPQNCITTHGSTLYSITINHAVSSFTRNYFYR